MTEEEKKKLEQAQQQTNTATQNSQQQAEANIQPDAVEQAIRRMESRASALNSYANSPVRIDTSNQPDWLDKIEQVRAEYLESPEQKAARERSERNNRRLSTLADGLIALSNVTGAMAGATPARQTSLSAAHRQAVEDAAVRRRANAQYYDLASRYYSGLQYKQNKDNAERYADELKSRRDAGKEAGNLLNNAARLRQSRENANRNYDLAEQRLAEQRRHNSVSESQSGQRINIAQQNANKRGGSNNQADWDEYAHWELEHPDEVNKIKTDNAQINPWTNMPEKSITSSTVRLVNAKMRQKYGNPEQKKRVQGFGTTKSSGKRKIAGFGN